MIEKMNQDSTIPKNSMPNTKRNIQGSLLTSALWGIGIALQFMAPLLRDRVPLSDDLAITSLIVPWWLFLQVVLLAGFLRLFQHIAERWSETGRMVFAIVSALAFMQLQPELLTQIVGNEPPLSANPMRVALLWSTPLVFYILPAALVIYSWLRRDSRLSLVRALGIDLVFIGVINFPFILWLTHLWAVYIRPFGH